MLAKWISGEHPSGLVLIIVLQIFCAGFFTIDVVADFLEPDAGLSAHLYIETLAAITLALAVVMESRQLIALLRRKAHLEDRVRKSEMTVHELIEESFSKWRLSPAEFDVAMFLFKGLNATEIAQIRGTSEGTVKAQCSAVYRKAGVQNRAELLMAVIDSLWDKESIDEKMSET